MKLMTTLSAILVSALFFVSVVQAAGTVGFGGVATNMLEPVSLFNSFVSAACFIIGGSFVFASIVKYIEHRRSPLMIPISTVMFLFVGGLLLIGLPFMWMLAKYANH